MENYICIHGHFYQPPRENPWFEAIELQDSAYPYHDWNERVTAECYAPNAKARILDEKGLIRHIVNNYSKISFDFGPTLLSWMEKNDPEVYKAILEADRESQVTFSGHGSALAQGYNHIILPLANQQDKVTQVRWGIKDFEHRFGRTPEGMWLPETAVDLETLDILAEQHIRFTLLAPHQAKRCRPLGAAKWQDCSSRKLDPTMPYVLRLPTGRSIVLFFYDGPISRAIAFEGLLNSGEAFLQRLLGAFSETRTWSQLVHIATDGETYGHHHRFGDMALAYALHNIESKKSARITNYGEYLEKHPPAHEVEIFENTSWSCSHGVERWRSNCGCNSGMNPNWHQTWRKPLRESLDFLRDTLASAFEEKTAKLLKDPWEARNDYLQVILNRSPENIEVFLSRHRTRNLTEEEKITVLKLLELQRHSLLMYTSCGWFFDELSRLETVQILRYAGRALQLSQDIFGDNLEPGFLQMMEGAKSNVLEFRNGRKIYDKLVRPYRLDLASACAHYALSSLFFGNYPDRSSLYCFTINQEDYQSAEAGKASLTVGRVTITSRITWESAPFSFGALHLGDHNVMCNVMMYGGDKAYQSVVDDVFEAFDRADFPETIRRLDKHFRASTFSLNSLFRDNQQKILEKILTFSLAEAEGTYQQIYENNVPLMRFLKDSRIPPPKAFYAAAELSLNASLRRAFESEDLNPDLINTFLKEARMEGITLDENTLEYALRKTLFQIADRFSSSSQDLFLLQKLESAIGLIHSLPFQVNPWKIQNICYGLLKTLYPELREKSEQRDKNAGAWVHHFEALCNLLSLRVN